MGSEALSGDELGRDVVRLRKILDSFPRYTKSSITGPDVTDSSSLGNIRFIKEFLNESGDALSALTWHPQFSSEHREKEDVYQILTQIQQQLDNVVWAKDITKPPGTKQISRKEVWISESNPEEYTGTFTDALVLIKRLGTTAMLGFPIFLKQLNAESVYRPGPDFWVTLLYKNLVGRAVLETKLLTGDRTTSYTFAHCTEMGINNRVIDSDFEYERGAVTIFGTNLGAEEIKLNIKLSFKDEPVHIYILTADNTDDLTDTYLNGQLLNLSPRGELPILSPKVKNATRNVIVDIPPSSVYYIVMPEAKVRTCMIYPIPQVTLVKELTEKLAQLTTTTSTVPPVTTPTTPTTTATMTTSTTTSAATSTTSENVDKRIKPKNGKEVYVRFALRKKKKDSSDEEDEGNTSTTAGNSVKIKIPLPEAESPDEIQLDRTIKSIKNQSSEFPGKNKIHRVKDSMLRSTEKLKHGKKYEDVNDKEVDEDVQEIMSKTKFIMFSDEDWLSDFSHAKKAVNAAKKIIEAFDEAESMRKTSDSLQLSKGEVLNDRNHNQMRKDGNRKKKSATPTTENSDSSSVVDDLSPENSEEITVPEMLIGNNMKTNVLKLNHDMLSAKTKKKRDVKQAFPNLNGSKIIKSNSIIGELKKSDGIATKLNIHPSLITPRKIITSESNSDFLKKLVPTEQTNETDDVYVKARSDSDINMSNIEYHIDKCSETSSHLISDDHKHHIDEGSPLNYRIPYAEKEIETVHTNNKKEYQDEENSKPEMYHPREFYEHSQLQKIKVNNGRKYEDLSEADLTGLEQHESQSERDEGNLSIKQLKCNHEVEDKRIKHEAEKQLNKYYDNVKYKLNSPEELNDDSNLSSLHGPCTCLEKLHNTQDSNITREKRSTDQQSHDNQSEHIQIDTENHELSQNVMPGKTQESQIKVNNSTQSLVLPHVTTQKPVQSHVMNLRKKPQKNNLSSADYQSLNHTKNESKTKRNVKRDTSEAITQYNSTGKEKLFFSTQEPSYRDGSTTAGRVVEVDSSLEMTEKYLQTNPSTVYPLQTIINAGIFSSSAPLEKEINVKMTEESSIERDASTKAEISNYQTESPIPLVSLKLVKNQIKKEQQVAEPLQSENINLSPVSLSQNEDLETERYARESTSKLNIQKENTENEVITNNYNITGNSEKDFDSQVQDQKGIKRELLTEILHSENENLSPITSLQNEEVEKDRLARQSVSKLNFQKQNSEKDKINNSSTPGSTDKDVGSDVQIQEGVKRELITKSLQTGNENISPITSLQKEKNEEDRLAKPSVSKLNTQKQNTEKEKINNSSTPGSTNKDVNSEVQEQTGVKRELITETRQSTNKKLSPIISLQIEEPEKDRLARQSVRDLTSKKEKHNTNNSSISDNIDKDVNSEVVEQKGVKRELITEPLQSGNENLSQIISSQNEEPEKDRLTRQSISKAPPNENTKNLIMSDFSLSENSMKGIEDKVQDQREENNKDAKEKSVLNIKFREETQKNKKDINTVDENSNQDEIFNNDLDIVCGRTKNFGTFCIGSERKAKTPRKSLISNHSTKSSLENTNKKSFVRNNHPAAILLNDIGNLGEMIGSVYKINLDDTDNDDDDDTNLKLLKRREITGTQSEFTKSDRVREKEEWYKYLDEGSPTCKASRSAPFIEDIEELLSQIENIEESSNNMRHRRLIHFTVPAVDVKKINSYQETSNIDTDEFITDKKPEGNYHQNDIFGLGSRLSENSLQPISNYHITDLYTREPDSLHDSSYTSQLNDNTQGDSSGDIKTNSNGNKYARHTKRTITPFRNVPEDSLHYTVQYKKPVVNSYQTFKNYDTFDGYSHNDDNNYGYPQQQQTGFGENEFGYEENSELYPLRSKPIYKSRGSVMHPSYNDGKIRNYNNEEYEPQFSQSVRNSDLSNNYEGIFQQPQLDRSHFTKNPPIHNSQIMLKSPHMYKPQLQSKSLSHRARRSLAPYFHNFRNDITMNNEMYESRPQNTGGITQLASSQIAKHQLIAKRNALTNSVSGNQKLNEIIKERNFRKRSIRNINNYEKKKQELFQEFSDEEEMLNDILNERKKTDELLKQDLYDIELLKNKNKKMFQSLTNGLDDLADTYLDGSKIHDTDHKSNNHKVNSYEKSFTNSAKILNEVTPVITVSRLKSSAEEAENKASEMVEKNPDSLDKENKNEASEIGKTKSNSLFYHTPISFLVDQMKNFVHFITRHLRNFTK